MRNSTLFAQAEDLREQIAQDIGQISPEEPRFKRGLINGVGTAIKYVFGNPDADDLDRINDHIQNLEKDGIAYNDSIIAINN
ncbi:hypothetical protein TKK_0009531 [Trichogramma kaykai]|uniref:Uncharacterized protein n=1 Tax=Trichogramma kaykai TaxID=54128 RepID=A0ABD2WZH7_9HYME